MNTDKEGRMDSKESEYLRVSEAAQLLQTDAAYVIGLIAGGELPHIRKGGGDEGTILIPREAVAKHPRYFLDPGQFLGTRPHS